MSPSTPASAPWEAFTQDPRLPESAALRASDHDRDVVQGVLAEGYADGRLTKDEYDERSGAAAAAKTLGELPVLILDLVPQSTSRPGSELALATGEQLHALAVRRWQDRRRRALRTLLVASLVVWTFWFLTSYLDNPDHPGFPWPVLVTLFTVVRLVQVQLDKRDIIEREQARLERKQRVVRQHPRPPL